MSKALDAIRKREQKKLHPAAAKPAKKAKKTEPVTEPSVDG